MSRLNKIDYKQIRLSFTALTKSFGISSEEAQKIVANSFYYKTIDALAKKIQENPNDFDFDDSEISAIERNMLLLLSDSLSTDGKYHIELVKMSVDSISPFNKKPKVLKPKELSETYRYLPDYRVSDVFQKVKEQVNHPKMHSEIGFHEFSRAAKITADDSVEPLCYLSAIRKITKWNFVSNMTHDTIRVFNWFDKNENEHPVIIHLNCYAPSLQSDVSELMETLNEDRDFYDNKFDKPIILFGKPVYQEIDSLVTCIIGVWFNGESWHWLLLSEMTPDEQLILFPSSKIECSSDFPTPDNLHPSLTFRSDVDIPKHFEYCTISKSMRIKHKVSIDENDNRSMEWRLLM